MKKIYAVGDALIFIGLAGFAGETRNIRYITIQKPLAIQPCTSLPMGAIKTRARLLKMLEVLYEEVALVPYGCKSIRKSQFPLR